MVHGHSPERLPVEPEQPELDGGAVLGRHRLRDQVELADVPENGE